MSLIIFSCSPRAESKSNTTAIVNAFASGFTSENENKVEVNYLYRRKEWSICKKAFEENTEIIFALPLFVECVPGLVLEFLEYLEPKKNNGKRTTIGFILQGGFEEAHQLRTAERYLEKLPHYLNCDYVGTLLKGGMFTLSVSSESSKKKMLQPFRDMGKLYARERAFEKSVVSKFALPETYSKTMIFLIHLLKPLNKVAWMFLSNKLNVKGKLNTRPYEI